MDTLRMTGRRLVFWGALLLIAVSIFEFIIRLDDFKNLSLLPTMRMVFRGQFTSARDYLGAVRWSDLIAHLFLLVTLLYGLFALFTRKRPIAIIISIPLAILLIIFFVGSRPLNLLFFWQYLELIPLMMILAGNVILLISFFTRDKQKPDSPGATFRAQPYNPFGIRRRKD